MGFSELQSQKVREYWEHAEDTFITWLAMELRSTERSDLESLLDADLEVIDTVIGKYEVDVLARSRDTDETYIIVDFVTGDPDPLRSFAAAGDLDADVVVWIAPEFDETQLDAIEWLAASNRDPRVVLVEFEIWRIGDSDPAVRLKRVSIEREEVSQYRGPAPDPSWTDSARKQLKAINGRLQRSLKKDDNQL